MTKYYIQDGACGTEMAFSIIGSKWVPEILELCLSNKEFTFSELRKNLPGITDATLSRQLNTLIRNQMVVKNTSINESTRSIFVLTPKALDILPTITLMKDFSLQCNYKTSGFNNPIEHTNKLIGSKWKSRIIWIIYNSGTIRFNALHDSIEGISSKMLNQQLTYLESNDIVIKKDYHEKSPRVEYSLTDIGRTAYLIVQSLADWCQKYNLLKPRIVIDY